MKTDLAQLSSQTMTLIAQSAGKNDVESIKRLSDTATRIRALQENLATIEHDAASIEEFLSSFTARPPSILAPVESPEQEFELDEEFGGRSRAKTLRIEIDWSRLGKPGGREVISDSKASETMTRFVHRLYTQIGIGVLDKLATFRISRGPMVSKTPQRDFMNQAKGTPYGHQRVPGTPYYVLTHSQTSQKVGDLKEAYRFLGLTPGAVQISEAAK